MLKLSAKLSNLSWVTAAVADVEIKQGKFDDAADLIRRLQTFAAINNRLDLLSWADRLYHEIEYRKSLPACQPPDQLDRGDMVTAFIW